MWLNASRFIVSHVFREATLSMSHLVHNVNDTRQFTKSQDFKHVLSVIFNLKITAISESCSIYYDIHTIYD